MTLSITAIITTQNRPDYLRTSLQSVLNQERLPEQIIIVDDASTVDYDWQTIQSSAPNILIKRLETVHGANACRNIGLALAQSNILAFLDDDDAWKPQYLASIEQAYIDEPDISGTTSGKEIMDTDCECIVNSAAYVSLEELKMGNTYCGMSGVTVKASVAKSFRFDEELQNGQDWDFFIRVVNGGAQLKNLSQALYLYRRGTQGGITQRLKTLRPEAAEKRLLSAIKHRAWLGEKAFKKRVLHQLLHNFTSRRYKLGWLILAAKYTGWVSTTKYLLIRRV
ncbi:glycosyltransferase family 2 protein [Glaciecola siphonariae]|uniref:Glycosyltransferase family 2 protein n=1 Tax=Glaciecola siphonariae TaxID=521012 RepID=A0ABV9M254_9ALTE